MFRFCQIMKFIFHPRGKDILPTSIAFQLAHVWIYKNVRYFRPELLEEVHDLTYLLSSSAKISGMKHNKLELKLAHLSTEGFLASL